MSSIAKGLPYSFVIGLPSQADSDVMQVNPTLATGDVKVSIDGGSLANIATLPTVSPAGGKLVLVSLSASEMNGSDIAVIFSDAAGDEWTDVVVHLKTEAGLVGGTVNDVSATATSFVTTLTEATNDHFKSAFVLFLDGALLGQSGLISAYNGTTKQITLATALTDAPANGTKFLILGRSE